MLKYKTRPLMARIRPAPSFISQVGYDEHIDVIEIFVVKVLVGVLAVHPKTHDLAFRAGEIRSHFHDIDLMIAGDEVQEESAEGDVGHSDLALEGYRAIELSASPAARNIDPAGDEFDRHFGPPFVNGCVSAARLHRGHA